ncbi:hypothetical protein [Marinococcus sp. PL1-022]|uniref:hypothetical protein n=1 Tax=Marinococcus sp. PL1-022 TaxID=3095363 RepID=UPI0029C39FAA|nr:hypothetical protein [Marinococcus sp. PL1-022]MDX6154465.1 hypothetical protein [Marinococcus sp. PL1-022]
MSLEYRMTDLADKLGLKESTARKYYLLIEKNGHHFRRNQQGHILFSEEDAKLFSRIIELKNQPNMTVQDAVNSVINIMNEENGSYKPHADEQGLMNRETWEKFSSFQEEIHELKSIIQKQNALIEKQQETFEQRENMLWEKLERIEEKLNDPGASKELETEKEDLEEGRKEQRPYIDGTHVTKEQLYEPEVQEKHKSEQKKEAPPKSWLQRLLNR